MNNKQSIQTDAAELRSRAEVQLKAKAGHKEVVSGAEAAHRLESELQAHKIELEMQNEELRQARAEAETALQRYIELYDFAPTGYFIMDKDGAISQANLAAARILKLERAKLLGRRFGAFVASRSQHAFHTLMDRISSEQVKASCECELADANDETVFVLIEALPGKARDEYYLMVIDITESKQTGQNLFTLHTVVEKSPISLVIADADANIQYVNPHFTEVTGYTAAEAIGRNPRMLHSGLTPKETYQEMWGKISSGQVWRGEFVNKRKNGKLYWEEAHIAPVIDAAGNISNYVSMKIDITQRKRAEQANAEMLRQNRTLTSSMFAMQEENLRKIVCELHDELGQWLTAIQAEAQVISSIADSAPTIRDSARAISRSAGTMHEVMHRMAHNLRPSLLDALGLKEALRELEKQWRQPHPDIACEFNLEKDLGDLGDGLKITIFRLVQEALNNVASHAMASQVSVQLRRVAGETADFMLLSIEDNGAGFDPAMPTEGTGLLGMRERTIAAGGEFDLASAPGSGTRINIKLPLLVHGGLMAEGKT